MASIVTAGLSSSPPDSPQLVSKLYCPLRLPNQSRQPTRRCRTTIITRSSSEGTQLPDLFKQLGQSLWGQGLPPGALVGAVRSAWTTGWTVMMKQLAPSDKQGGYQRPNSNFRNRLAHPVSASDHGRYHLYVSLTCPWAHRTAIVHALKGLGDAVPLSVTVPGNTGLWEFRPHQGIPKEKDTLLPTIDRAHRRSRLMEVYKLRKGGYDGRATVPMLWDSVEQEVVNNESADIIEMLNSDFNHLAVNPQLDLAPPHLLNEIEKWNGMIYPKINNGVYRCGFAQGQEAYEEAVKDLFSVLDMLEEHLTSSRFLCDYYLTLADIRLFTTLYRFDPVYYVLFKCSKRKLSEYPNLYGYLCDVYQVPGVAATCDLPTIMDGYYKVLFPLNPGGISPVIPVGSESTSLISAHNRETISSSMKLSSIP